jgi:very-short-patch-repair endonuclease
MEGRNIVIGQRVPDDKAALARQLRRKQTPDEKLLWEQLRANRLHGMHFRRQQVIDGFIVDFYCHAARLVIELDGPAHARRREEDAHREHVLQGRGIHVLRTTNDELHTNLDAVLRRILAAIDAPLPVSGRGRGRGP